MAKPQGIQSIFNADFNPTPFHQRVLKPPGGGSSDIFGATEANPQPERRSKNHNQSSLPFGDTDSTDTASVKSDGATNSGDECASAKPKERETISPSDNRPAAPARQRIPPGGFSSGLW